MNLTAVAGVQVKPMEVFIPTPHTTTQRDVIMGEIRTQQLSEKVTPILTTTISSTTACHTSVDTRMIIMKIFPVTLATYIDIREDYFFKFLDLRNISVKCAVSSTQKFLVQQHITTSKHQANKQLNSKQRQLFLTQPTTSNVRSEFNIDLCRSLISADIPLYKLKNKVFREFLEKYTQHTIPDESTLRKTYAPSIYDETIQKIRDEIKDSSIWVSIDETPDKEDYIKVNDIRVSEKINTFASAHISQFRLYSVDEIGDSEMVFDKMRSRIGHKLPDETCHSYNIRQRKYRYDTSVVLVDLV
ncbi:hypothetical protein ANN_07825 [Periplaneta americana]|uniref:Uncharacterized protein n=1 Tax=Periplaneta americana TaxID=6978 RepID=A0ABQ8T1A4_PERAM|nr:hypothetical protein ANN_07825 [Periplaneta americana]